jgi:hypothetical protein
MKSTSTTFDNEARSIYFQTGDRREFVMVPQSGRVRELSEGEKRLRERSGRSSASSSRVRSGVGMGVLYLLPEGKRFYKDELLRICSSKDRIQEFFLN